MSEIIAPSVAARLRFFVTDPTTGVGVTGLTHSTITTAGYATETNGVRSATTSVTLTSTAAVTAALATGQVVEYGFGQYGIDVPAVGISGLIFAVVTVTGKEVRSVRNQIREAAELNTAQYDAIIAAAEGSALTGPYARTVTVTDSDTSTAIQNAKVRLYRTGETGTETTNVSGVATFTVEAATWSYAITANGYTGVAGTIAVSANGNTPIAMVAATVTPPTNPSLSAIEVLCLGVDFEAESDIDIDFRIAEIETGDQNKTYSGAKVTVSSDSNGIARWEAPQGFVVEYKRGNTHSWQRVTLDSDSATNVTSVIGSP